MALHRACQARCKEIARARLTENVRREEARKADEERAQLQKTLQVDKAKEVLAMPQMVRRATMHAGSKGGGLGRAAELALSVTRSKSSVT